MPHFLLIDSSDEPAEDFPLRPPKVAREPALPVILPPPQEPALPVIFPPPQAPLIQSPTKRGRAPDAKQRIKKPRISRAGNQEEPLEIAETIFQGPEYSADTSIRDSERHHSQEFKEYSDAVLSEVAGFIQIASDICVVQGWDARRSQATVSSPTWLSQQINTDAREELLVSPAICNSRRWIESRVPLPNLEVLS